MSAARSLAVVPAAPIPFTGSSAGRAALCPASCVLPQADSHGDDARDGTLMHAYLAVVSLSPASKSEALKALPPHLRARAAAIDVATILDGFTVRGVEMSYAHNVDTGEARELGMHRDRREVYAGLGARELGCTLDLVGTVRGLTAAKDWKTGRADYGPADEAWQLKIAGLVLRAVTGADEVLVSFDYIDHEGGHRPVEALLGPFDLDQAAEDLRGVVARVEELRGVLPRNLDTYEGDHCTYCPAFDSCPSKHRLARIMVDEAGVAGIPTEEEIRALAPEQAGELWTRLERFLDVGERVKVVLKEYARRRRLPLPNGRDLGAIEVRGRAGWDKEKAIDLLLRLGATNAQLAELETRGAPHTQIRELKR